MRDGKKEKRGRLPLFYPHQLLKRITDLDPQALWFMGVRGIILDVDNTLTTHNSPVPGECVMDWLQRAEACGLKRIILSNNTPDRVRPFAEMLGLGFTANGKKPLPSGVRRAAREMGLSASETALIGDQIFTDVLAGRLAGAVSILVEPIEPETAAFFRLKRRLEAPILKRYQRRLTALGGRRPDKTEGGIK